MARTKTPAELVARYTWEELLDKMVATEADPNGFYKRAQESIRTYVEMLEMRVGELEAELAGLKLGRTTQAEELLEYYIRAERAEAELEALHEEMVRYKVIAERHIDEAEAELAALKARRCEDCGWEYCTTEDQSESWVDDTSLGDTSTDFYCAQWKARP